MLDHITLIVSDYARAKKFYEAALKPLGYSVQMEFGPSAGMGQAGKPDFWIAAGKPGIRKDYHPNYYGAFVFDPDGHNIEAVCHKPA